MKALQLYINGEFVTPQSDATLDVIDPSTTEVIARVPDGGAADVDRAVKAARKAFETWSRTTREERIALLERVRDDLASCIGCGCLSLRSCRLFNPVDRAAQAGPGARYLLGDRPGAA